jgi:peptidoglycan hydrolase-like protein with peptidoglycan-binding domain
MTGKAEVRDAQQALNDKGYDAGPVDGILGPKTKAALQKFQKDQGMQATGRLDSNTIAALGISPSGPTASSDTGRTTSSSMASGTRPDIGGTSQTGSSSGSTATSTSSDLGSGTMDSGTTSGTTGTTSGSDTSGGSTGGSTGGASGTSGTAGSTGGSG